MSHLNMLSHGADPVQVVDHDKVTSQYRLEKRVFPEVSVSGFAHIDQEVGFFVQVAALLRPTDIVLDFGAGRGAWFHDDPVRYRRDLQNFRGRCAHVDGCDIDDAVLENQSLDAAKLFSPGGPLPYPDNRFDIIVTRYVFEHLPDPEWAAGELLRVLKPGGWICVMTPNKWGYVALAARLLPNRFHTKALGHIQPSRRDVDVFPTVYRLNTVRDVRRHFGHAADVYHYRTSGVPSYHLDSFLLFRLQLFLNRLMPSGLDVGLRFFIQKRAASTDAGSAER